MATKEQPLPAAILFSHHSAPYRDPVLDAVSNRGRVKILVAEYSDKCSTHPEWEWPPPRYPRSVLEGANGVAKAASALRLVKRQRPDVIVIPGISHPASAALLGFATIKGLPFVYSADSVSFQRGNSYAQPAKRLVLKAVLRLAAAAWVPGKASSQFLGSHGLSRDRIFEGCYCLDEGIFPGQVQSALSVRDAVRDDLDIPRDHFVFLFVGSMIPVRRVGNLLRAFSQLKRQFGRCSLLLVGGGEEHSQIARDAASIADVRLTGPVPLRRVPEYYAASDAYVHPGCEAYSLAVAEASLAGLPVIATNCIGASYDYIHHGATGFLVGVNDIADLEQRMATLVSDRQESMAMGARGKVAALRRSREWAAEQLEAAILLSAGSRNTWARRR